MSSLKNRFSSFDFTAHVATAKRVDDEEMRPDSSYLVVGDMNDPEDSELPKRLVQSATLKLVSGLTNAPRRRRRQATIRDHDSSWVELDL
jgi:hypothetical protein